MAVPDFAATTPAALLAALWRALEAAAEDRHSPWHTMVVASADAEAAPDLRTVVLRGCVPAARSLRFHTDRRSAKIPVFGANPRAAFLFYDPVSKIQLRARGRIALVTEGSLFDQVWAATAAMSRRCYLTDPAPGTPADRPMTGLAGDLGARRPSAAESEAGRAHFTLALAAIDALDWLHLAADGHRRAQFFWQGEGEGLAAAEAALPGGWRGGWVAP
jgi:hypothetical protein